MYSSGGLIFKIALCTLCEFARFLYVNAWMRSSGSQKELDAHSNRRPTLKDASVPSPLFHDGRWLDPDCDR